VFDLYVLYYIICDTCDRDINQFTVTTDK